MDYEEKYKYAIDRAMNLFVTNNISATAVCEIFPELNESEEVNYEKKYKKALEWMRSLYSGLHGATKEDAEHYFPELKESEDERIRKAIHIYLDWLDGRKDYAPKGSYTIKDMIAWLEKQGEQKPFPKQLDADKVIEWLNENVADFWANPCNPNRVINQFKKDFGLC